VSVGASAGVAARAAAVPVDPRTQSYGHAIPLRPRPQIVR